MILFGIINYTYTWYDPKGGIGPQEFADMAVDGSCRALRRERLGRLLRRTGARKFSEGSSLSAIGMTASGGLC